jgi:signal transduction histidine kinase
MINFFKSFSFKAGLLLFVVISATLILLRILTYQQAVEATYADIRSIVAAHLVEIEEVMEHDDPEEIFTFVHDVAQERQDPHLYIGFTAQGRSEGNLPLIDLALNRENWQELSLPARGEGEAQKLYIKARQYPDHKQLVVGYDLIRVAQLRDALMRGLIENFLLSLLLSSALSVLLIYLLNSHLHKFNLAFQRVMSGDLAYRLPIQTPIDQFDHLGKNLNEMLDWIEVLIGTVKDSSNALAHDLRTPLSRHRLELNSLLHHHKLPTEIRETLAFSIQRIDGLVEMFENILSIASAESRSDTALFAPLDLSALIMDIAEFYEPLIDQKNQQLVVNLPPKRVVMRGDKQLLGKAILNLLDNAVKYTSEGGKIEMTLQVMPEAMTVCIADNGMGIPAELVEKAKQRFVRLDESRHTEGTGLGFSLIEAVAKLHRGSLSLADNQPGLRATLHFRV